MHFLEVRNRIGNVLDGVGAMYHIEHFRFLPLANQAAVPGR